jgi:hypothetical protein
MIRGKLPSVAKDDKTAQRCYISFKIDHRPFRSSSPNLYVLLLLPLCVVHWNVAVAVADLPVILIPRTSRRLAFNPILS